MFAMDEAELDKIITAWIAAQQAKQGSPEYATNWWAVSEVMDWALEGVWRNAMTDEVWQRVQAVRNHVW